MLHGIVVLAGFTVPFRPGGLLTWGGGGLLHHFVPLMNGIIELGNLLHHFVCYSHGMIDRGSFTAPFCMHFYTGFLTWRFYCTILYLFLHGIIDLGGNGIIDLGGFYRHFVCILKLDHCSGRLLHVLSAFLHAIIDLGVFFCVLLYIGLLALEALLNHFV